MNHERARNLSIDKGDQPVYIPNNSQPLRMPSSQVGGLEPPSPPQTNLAQNKQLTYAYAIKSQLESINNPNLALDQKPMSNNVPAETLGEALDDKLLDYVFILISNESFKRFYKDTRIYVQYPNEAPTTSSNIPPRGPVPFGQSNNTPQT